MAYPIRQLIVGGALAAALPNIAAAQDSEGDSLASGLGQFDLSGSIELGIGYDDNVYAQRNDKQSDGLWLLTPQLDLSREGEVFDFKFYGEAEIGRYWSESSEDYNDAELGLSASAEVADGQEVFGGLSYAWEHEDRSSPDAVNGLEPQEYANLRGHLGYGATFGETELRVGGTYERLDFDDVATTGDPIDGDVRDRDLYTVGARVGQDIGGGWWVFGQAYGDYRSYEMDADTTDPAQFDRDSEGLTLAGGLRYRPRPNLDIEVLGGLIYQTYDDPRFDDVVAPDIGAQFDWRPNPKTRVVAHMDRTLEETTATGSSGIVSTAAGVTISRLLRRDFSLYGGLDVIQDDYQDISRDELTFLADAGLRHYVSPRIYLDFNYNFARRDSDVSAFDYDNHQVFFSIGAQLDERFPEGAAAGFADPTLEGFYGGVQASLGSLHSEMEGDRGQGTLTSDFGAFGAGGGVFGGYGVSIDNWYLALELDGELSGAEWDHARSPGGRVFSVTKDWSVGVGPVVGYRLERGALPYARLGVVATSFDTDYMTGSGSQFGESREEIGLRLGGGLELPTGDGLFLRMDYSYTSYPDYDISPPSGDDNFANSESLVRLGLGYRFNDDQKVDVATPAYDPGGFYAGAQGGITSLFSEVSGPRGTDEDPSFLSADFSDEGLNLGAFGGYGQTFDRIYLGVEGDLEIGVARPDHDRGDERRNSSVDKRWSAGLNARVGYKLGPAGMVYLRGGPVISGFETDYEQDETSVSRSEGELGWRIGAGLETPLNDKLTLRVDYSYTDYEDYDVAYGDAGGVDTFDNSESLFRVGVAWRF